MSFAHINQNNGGDTSQVCLPPSCCLKDSQCPRPTPICNVPSGQSQGVCWGCSSNGDCAGKSGGNYCLKHPGDATGNCVLHQGACWTDNQCSSTKCNGYTVEEMCLLNADGTGYGICVSTQEMTTGISCT